MIKSNFREWTLDKIDEAFGTEQIKTLPVLDSLLAFQHEPDDFEKKYILRLQGVFELGGDDWNEVELENKFISPLIVFAEVNTRKFSYFLERYLEATIGEYEVSGLVDGMIAEGFRNPRKPYFCLNEYKKGTDPNGDPKGQVLIAMLAAQEHNQDDETILGCFVIGKHWHFIALHGKKYAISKSFTCDDDEVFDIFRILKGLKFRIEQLAG